MPSLCETAWTAPPNALSPTCGTIAYLAADYEQGYEEQQNRTNGVAGHEDPASRPPVEKDPDEWPEHGEGQQDRSEGRGDCARSGGSLRGEKDGGCKGDLEDAIRALGQ